MEEKKDIDAVTYLFVLLVAVVLGFLGGALVVESDYRRLAVEHGAARWVVQNPGGSVKFEWIDQAQKR